MKKIILMVLVAIMSISSVFAAIAGCDPFLLGSCTTRCNDMISPTGTAVGWNLNVQGNNFVCQSTGATYTGGLFDIDSDIADGGWCNSLSVPRVNEGPCMHVYYSETESNVYCAGYERAGEPVTLANVATHCRVSGVPDYSAFDFSDPFFAGTGAPGGITLISDCDPALPGSCTARCNDIMSPTGTANIWSLNLQSGFVCQSTGATYTGGPFDIDSDIGDSRWCNSLSVPRVNEGPCMHAYYSETESNVYCASYKRAGEPVTLANAATHCRVSGVEDYSAFDFSDPFFAGHLVDQVQGVPEISVASSIIALIAVLAVVGVIAVRKR